MDSKTFLSVLLPVMLGVRGACAIVTFDITASGNSWVVPQFDPSQGTLNDVTIVMQATPSGFWFADNDNNLGVTFQPSGVFSVSPVISSASLGLQSTPSVLFSSVTLSGNDGDVAGFQFGGADVSSQQDVTGPNFSYNTSLGVVVGLIGTGTVNGTWTANLLMSGFPANVAQFAGALAPTLIGTPTVTYDFTPVPEPAVTAGAILLVGFAVSRWAKNRQ